MPELIVHKMGLHWHLLEIMMLINSSKYEISMRATLWYTNYSSCFAQVFHLEMYLSDAKVDLGDKY